MYLKVIQTNLLTVTPRSTSDTSTIDFASHRHICFTFCAGRYFLSPSVLPLSTFTEIRKKTGHKLNSVVGYCLYRALHRFSQDINSSTFNNITTSNGYSNDHAKGIQNGHNNGYKNSGHINGYNKSDHINGSVRNGHVKEGTSTGLKLKPSVVDEKDWCYTIANTCSLWIPGDKLELTVRSSAINYSCLGSELQVRPATAEEDQDRLRALANVSRTLDEPCKFDYSWTAYRFTSVLWNSMPTLFQDIFQYNRFCECLTGVFSNVRGPDEDQMMFGKPLTMMTGYITMWKNLGTQSILNPVTLVTGIIGPEHFFKTRHSSFHNPLLP